MIAKSDSSTQINGLFSPWLQSLRFRKAMPWVRGKRLLDVGCSQGELLQWLPDVEDYVGVEGREDICAHARAKHPQHQFINLYLDKDNVTSLDIKDRDTILMLAVLEHLEHPAEVLAGLGRYLVPGGRIVLTTPSPLGKPILDVGSWFGFFMSEMDEHHSYFSRKRLHGLCRQAGYRMLRLTSFEAGLNHLAVMEKTER